MINAVPTMTMEVITPSQAQKYLEVSAPNRITRQGVIEQYARDMAKGKWHSSVLRFGEDGQLWDGQHRLWAVIESGTDQSFWVERGIPLAAIPTIDSGVKRTIGDTLAIRGETSANILAAAMRMARHLMLYPGRAPSGGSRFAASTQEALDFLEANPDIRNSIPIARRVTTALRLPPSLTTALHYLESKRDATKADRFWYEIETGIEQEEGSGAHAFRQVLIANATAQPGSKYDQNMVVALAIKAWNNWEAGKFIKQLRWLRAGGEPFPIIGKQR